VLSALMRGDTVTDVNIPSDADVMVFQRIAHRYMAQAVSVIRRKGVAVVIDMDDDLTCIHPANPAFELFHPRRGNPHYSWEHTLRACEAATLVTVSTPALLTRYARHGRGHVLYNMVPARYLDVPHEDNDVIGWGGSVHSHPTDLQVMGPAIAQLIQSGHRFKIAGSGYGAREALGLSERASIETTGNVPIGAWPLALNTLGVGVAPLAESKFNQSKSWLKMLEYAAVGVPCVASPRPEYARLHKLGVGVVARTPREWHRWLRDLAGSAELRAEVAGRGRDVARDHTIEGNAWRWLETWERARDAERRSTPVAT
jgi:glycosyltransferase involved in cell wall biosynthesis